MSTPKKPLALDDCLVDVFFKVNNVYHVELAKNVFETELEVSCNLAAPENLFAKLPFTKLPIEYLVLEGKQVIIPGVSLLASLWYLEVHELHPGYVYQLPRTFSSKEYPLQAQWNLSTSFTPADPYSEEVYVSKQYDSLARVYATLLSRQ